ncbi:MAG: hypothetical protein ACRD0N_02635 [Acidimicrobiales bacterium]
MTGSDADDLARKARTLAQAHPLTPLADQFVNRAVAEQTASQPAPEIGTWAGTCLLNGYCLRRVEENEAGLMLQLQQGADVDLERLGEEAARIAAQLRAGEDDALFLIGDDRVVPALDRIISSEVAKRLDNLRTALEKDAIVEIEEFLTWWTVQGYGLRAAEKACGSVA